MTWPDAVTWIVFIVVAGVVLCAYSLERYPWEKKEEDSGVDREDPSN